MGNKTITMPLSEYNVLINQGTLAQRIERLMDDYHGMDYRVTVWQEGSHIDIATAKVSEIVKELAEANHNVGKLSYELDEFREMSLLEKIKYHFKNKR